MLIMNLSYGIRPEKLRHRTSLLIWSGVMKKDNKGFSLVELLIAIAISSIVLMALVMSYYAGGQKLHEADSFGTDTE